MDLIYKALADKNRRKIIELLKVSDMTVNEIGKHFPITGASLSYHLNTLKQAHLVMSVRKGQFILYTLNTAQLKKIVKSLTLLFS